MASKNEDDLASFASYCYSHPEQRFWQALRNWSESYRINRVWYDKDGIEQSEDTFYKK